MGGQLGIMVQLALRNVRRYARRSIITATTIALGVVMLILTVGVSEGSYRRAIDTAARSGSGHVVVRAADFDPLDPKPLSDPERAVALASAVPDAHASPRLQTPVLAQSTRGSRNVLLLGVDPELERRTSILPESLVEGEWLPAESGRIPKAVVGRTIARRLKLEVGDRLVLTTASGDDIQARLVRVGGIFATGSGEVDGGLVLLALEDARALLEQPGAVHEVAVVLDDLHRAAPVQRQLAADLPDEKVLTWAQAVPELGDFIAMDRAGGDAMFFILFGLVSLAVLNAVLMSVLERVREFGMMLALGTRPGVLFGVVVIEALVLSVSSAIVGAALGAAVVLYLGEVGMDLSSLTGTDGAIDIGGYDISGTMYPYLPLQRTLIDAVAVVLITVSVSLYPAWKATRIQPVDAIGHG